MPIRVIALQKILAIGLAGLSILPNSLLAEVQVRPATQMASLSDLLSHADSVNPDVDATRESAAAARAAIPQAGALPDPVLTVGVTNFPVSDPGFRNDFMTMKVLGLSESFPFPGKRRLREKIAVELAEAAELETVRTRLRVRSEVKSLYYTLYELDRALEVSAENERLLVEFGEISAARYATGTGAQADVLRAQVERNQLLERIASLRQQRTATSAQLNALLDRPSNASIPTPEIPSEIRSAASEPAEGRRLSFAADSLPIERRSGLFDIDRLHRLSLQYNPSLSAHIHRIESQRQTVNLASKASLPDFNIAVSFAQRDGSRDMVSAMLSVPLPIFSSRKQGQAEIEETSVLRVQQAQRRSMVNDLEQQIAIQVADLQRAQDQLVLFSEAIIPQARGTLTASIAGYRVGNLDFLSLLDAQIKLFNHELSYHRLLTEFAKAIAELERVVGLDFERILNDDI